MRYPFVIQGPLMMPAGAPGGGAGAGDTNPNPGAAPFDATAFEARMAELFNKGINALDKKIKGLEEKMAAPPPAPAPAPGVDPNNPNPAEPHEPPKAKTQAELTLDVTRLQRQFEASQKAQKDAEAKAAEKEALVIEGNRKAAFMSSIQDFQFANPKARQQFIDAYQSKVKVNDQGEHIVDTDAGPVTVKQFMESEFDSSPHFAAPAGHGGSGASGGSRVNGGNRIRDYANMTDAQVMQVPAAERNADWAELAKSL